MKHMSSKVKVRPRPAVGDTLISTVPQMNIAGLQEVPTLTQQQWLCLARMVMSAGDIANLACRLDDLCEDGPIGFRTKDGYVDLSMDGNFGDDDE